jgi:hypothetical protein
MASTIAGAYEKFTTLVPVDETNPISLTFGSTYKHDDLQSVTLTSFRKVIGYDTFDSIRKGNRDETKNPDDYYNVTYNILVKRNPS